ncbi:helicase HerA-like domain-containing protein [Streptomyces fuscigenes]|uniref:helicase HerA-like domain-containing protein n=1 Tax=Streptomyces fuscigenes TaxID=1528880 RepID=UPI0035590A19
MSGESEAVDGPAQSGGSEASGAAGSVDGPAGGVGERIAEIDRNRPPSGPPAAYLALGGAGSGLPVRATVTSFGPVLLARALGLDSAQGQALGLIFRYADARGVELVGLADLRAVVAFLVSRSGRDELRTLGGISTATAGALLRSLAALEQQGAGDFFGAPGFDTAELLRVPEGRGVVAVLEPCAVRNHPHLLPAILMWLLADLFHRLPESEDGERPRLVGTPTWFSAARRRPSWSRSPGPCVPCAPKGWASSS